ncbi:MAG: alpha/beta fold hydrolase [Pseudomonadota bacterium]
MSQTFVLVHGAWHGAWCWEAVAGILRARGHRVTTPVQIGVGERAGELRKGLTLADFIADVVGHLRAEDLSDAVLVGHSFAGSSLSGAAEAVPDRISRLIYLDALVISDGQTPFDGLPPEVIAKRRDLAVKTSGGLSLPPPSPDKFGVMDPAQQDWLRGKLTPHPLATFESAIKLQGPPGADLPRCYLTCTDPIYPNLVRSRERVAAWGWPMAEIRTGHDAMVSAPQALADKLLELTSS